MTAAGASPRPLHPALEDRRGSAIGAPGPTDRQRLAVLLQGASLLSLLEIVGWRLPRGWRGARVGREGVLRAVRAEPGRPLEPAQSRLTDLAFRLFPSDRRAAGRGQVRRLVRHFLEQWDQELVPIPADLAVTQLLEEADFLWEPSFAEARAALAGEWASPRGHQLWVAGPGRFRRSLLATAADRSELAARLASPESRQHWEGRRGREDPNDMARQGRWRAAAAAWRERPPAAEPERCERARVLARLGRFGEAERALRGLRSPAARILRIRCLVRLGMWEAARRGVSALEGADLRPAELLDLAESAVRAYGCRGDSERAASWVARARSRGGRQVLRAHLLAAEAAWDRGDKVALGSHLAAGRGALAEPGLAWRWRQLDGLRALAEGDPEGATSAFAGALAGHRRGLRSDQAAALWNELALGRALSGDLAGAERALLHAFRLLAASEGPRRLTLALSNLAEIRIRRGCLHGVRTVLERSAAENRRARNSRAQVYDWILWARFQLALGRPERALHHARRALAEQRRRGQLWQRGEPEGLAARALGWLGREEEAGDLLAAAPGAGACFEPEERPALWALAGDRERARQAAASGDFAALWDAVLSGARPPGGLWKELDRLEPWRAARLTYDLDRLRPGTVPSRWRERAARILRQAGAESMAGDLESGGTDSWPAVAAYLSAGDRKGEHLGELLARTGHPEARLTWQGRGRRRILVGGRGGPAELTAPLEGGILTLRCERLDGPLRVAFLLALRDLRPDAESIAEEPASGGGPIVGESVAVRRALERIAKLAPRDVPILISGETGTGKELAARSIRELSPRAGGPFLPLNCAALPESLRQTELFGHVRGAFTGAERDRPGVFEAARGGTVFLDEIGDLPLDAQGLLLRVLQEGEVRRVGESRFRRVDVRVVAATHRDLAQAVAERNFRKDLYYRLRVGSVRLPPLRERGEDVLLLAEHFLRRLEPEARLRIAPEARQALLSHSWPGNVRELENVLAVAAAVADEGTIRPEHLDLPPPAAARRRGYHEQVFRFRRRLVREALTAAGGNRAEAARRLGLSRQALSYLVRTLGLS